MNVKSKCTAQRTRDPLRAAIDSNTMHCTIIYLEKFRKWVAKWKESGKFGLSRQTFSALLHTVDGFIEMIPYLLSKKNVDYILLGEAQSDPLKGRFRHYRLLNGADHFNSVYSLLRAEKTLRIRSSVKDGYDIATIKNLFTEVEDKREKEDATEVENCLNSSEDMNFCLKIDDEDKSKYSIMLAITCVSK